MTIILPALAVAFAAFCVWLTIRFVNRRERWAKRALAATLSLPVLYVLSFGPACALVDRGILPPSCLETCFEPCLRLTFAAPNPVPTLLWFWLECCGGERVLYNGLPDPEFGRIDGA